MKRLWLLALACCTSKGPLPVPTAQADAGAGGATPASIARISHRAELLAEATTTGLDVVFQGWLDPKTELGAATADTCVRIRAVAAGDAGAPHLVLTDREADQETSATFSVHDAWIPPHCVRRGTRLTLAAGVPTEVVVVASAPFR